MVFLNLLLTPHILPNPCNEQPSLGATPRSKSTNCAAFIYAHSQSLDQTTQSYNILQRLLGQFFSPSIERVVPFRRGMVILFCSLMAICTICALLSFFKNRVDKSYPKLWWPGAVFPFIAFTIAILFQGPSHGPDAMAGMKYIPLLPFIALWILVSVISLFRFPALRQ